MLAGTATELGAVDGVLAANKHMTGEESVFVEFDNCCKMPTRLSSGRTRHQAILVVPTTISVTAAQPHATKQDHEALFTEV